MAAGGVEELESAISEALSKEFSKPVAAARPAPRVSPVHADTAPRLPQRISGGFRGVVDDLDDRAREFRHMVQLLEQQRPQLELAERERDMLSSALGKIVPEVQETGRSLKATIERAKAGDTQGDLGAQFAKSQKALDELESVAEALATNLLWVRTTWEQYARTITKAQKMREELKQIP